MPVFTGSGSTQWVGAGVGPVLVPAPVPEPLPDDDPDVDPAEEGVGVLAPAVPRALVVGAGVGALVLVLRDMEPAAPGRLATPAAGEGAVAAGRDGAEPGAGPLGSLHPAGNTAASAGSRTRARGRPLDRPSTTAA